jgi:hypothetical protein
VALSRKKIASHLQLPTCFASLFLLSRRLKISKWDIFHYVYGLLHHPGYRTKFADNLKRELPLRNYRRNCPFSASVADVPPPRR